jgi:hypothetical protein
VRRRRFGRRRNDGSYSAGTVDRTRAYAYCVNRTCNDACIHRIDSRIAGLRVAEWIYALRLWRGYGQRFELQRGMRGYMAALYGIGKCEASRFVYDHHASGRLEAVGIQDARALQLQR